MDLIRGFGPSQLDALRSSVFYPNLMVFVDWPGDPLRFNMGDRDLTWDGHTWPGFGILASLALPPETMGIASSTATLSIAGVDHDLDDQIGSSIRGKRVDISLALMSSQTGGVRIGDPVPLFKGIIGGGRMRTSSVSKDEVLSRIEVDLSTGPSARAESSIYHTDEDQRKKYPNDTAGRLVILSYARAQKLRWPE